MLILEENFRWHLEAFASELFIYIYIYMYIYIYIYIQCWAVTSYCNNITFCSNS